MPNGNPLLYGAGAGSTTDNSIETDSNPKDVKRVVDWCVALDLGWKDEDILVDAFATLNPNECSVNQSLSYIHRSPIFLEVELKKKQPATDPEVALAIWASGALQKKIHHGWDTSLPMPAVTIEGHVWYWYMFMPIKRASKNVVGLVRTSCCPLLTTLIGVQLMLGPFPMGTTATLVGAWQIVYRLNILIKWGTTTYSKWFQEQIIGWARDRAGRAKEGDSLVSGWG